MICSVKPVLTEEFSITWCMCEMYTSQKANMFKRDKPIFSSERKLHKGYCCKSSVAKISRRGLKGLDAKTN
jgi:hypothetical protein